jgi:class 3 adenylate cyclase
LGAESYVDALGEHRRVVRETCGAREGVEVDTQGDACFAAFPTATGALAAAAEITEALSAGPLRVRIGLHTGTPLLTRERYVGDDVHFAARIAAAGHGGQILVSAATAALATPGGSEPQALSLRDLGEHRLKDYDMAVPIYQLGKGSFPPLKTISNTNPPARRAPSSTGSASSRRCLLTSGQVRDS